MWFHSRKASYEPAGVRGAGGALSEPRDMGQHDALASFIWSLLKTYVHPTNPASIDVVPLATVGGEFGDGGPGEPTFRAVLRVESVNDVLRALDSYVPPLPSSVSGETSVIPTRATARWNPTTRGSLRGERITTGGRLIT